MLNKVTLIGNLGKEPEVRHLESGSVVAKFSLATNENYMDKSGEWQTITEWHDVICWRKLAERAEKQLKKGNLCYVEGKITKRKWQDKEGNDRYSTEVVAHTFKLLERRDSSAISGGASFPSAMDETPLSPKSPTTSAPKMEEADDDLPF